MALVWLKLPSYFIPLLCCIVPCILIFFMNSTYKSQWIRKAHAKQTLLEATSLTSKIFLIKYHEHFKNLTQYIYVTGILLYILVSKYHHTILLYHSCNIVAALSDFFLTLRTLNATVLDYLRNLYLYETSGKKVAFK